ncbi:MAG: DUF3795 domain-containing protein [Caldilineaceae bacterium]
MSVEILAKCGYRCDLCLAYRPNIEADDRRQELSDGWFNLYGFRIGPEAIACDGCVSSNSPNLIDKNCLVRPCVIRKGIENCACCNEFVCDKHKSRGVDRANLEHTLNRTLSETEYEYFVRPYEGERRLRDLRHVC